MPAHSFFLPATLIPFLLLPTPTPPATRPASPALTTSPPSAAYPPSAASALTASPPSAASALPSSAYAVLALPTTPSATPPPTPTGEWTWPLSPKPLVINGFWIGPAPWSPGHRGVDLATTPGAAVHSPAAGVVRFAGVIAGRGVLTVDHGGGAVSSFEPVSTTIRPGTVVRRGQPIAVLTPPPSGRTHCSPEFCLHWGVRLNGAYVDPLSFLPSRGPAVLLPLGHP